MTNHRLSFPWTTFWHLMIPVLWLKVIYQFPRHTMANFVLQILLTDLILLSSLAISILDSTLPDSTQIGSCRAKVFSCHSCSSVTFLMLIRFAEYAQALAFDQLKNLMANGQAFVGFQEATIDFPPTFKYDVLRTLSLSRRHKHHGSTRKLLDDKSQRLRSPDEKELDALETEDVEEAAGDAASMASTFATSVHSRAGTDREIEDDDYFHASPSSQTMATSTSKISVADKAKVKWMSLISPLSSGVTTPSTKLLRSKSKVTSGAHSSVDVTSDAVSIHLLPPGRSLSSERVDKTYLRPPPMIFVSSTKSSIPSDEEDADGRGVYDSSHKQRVPSWYVVSSIETMFADTHKVRSHNMENHRAPRS
jgi:hypothetical protein